MTWCEYGLRRTSCASPCRWVGESQTQNPSNPSCIQTQNHHRPSALTSALAPALTLAPMPTPLLPPPLRQLRQLIHLSHLPPNHPNQDNNSEQHPLFGSCTCGCLSDTSCRLCGRCTSRSCAGKSEGDSSPLAVFHLSPFTFHPTSKATAAAAAGVARGAKGG
jgi:hypothetical protein